MGLINAQRLNMRGLSCLCARACAGVRGLLPCECVLNGAVAIDLDSFTAMHFKKIGFYVFI